MPTANLPDIEEIQENFAFLEDWEDRFQYVIDLGKKVQPLPPEEVNEANRVHGCQSSVWLVADPADDGRMQIRAMSDAHIVNGLIAILLSLYSGRAPREVLAIDAEKIFEDLGLEEHLSPTRRNGLHAMIARVRKLASQHVDSEPGSAAEARG